MAVKRKSRAGRPWRRLVAQVLREQPWCACGNKATTGGHIIPFALRPDLELVRSNVVGQCAPCNYSEGRQIQRMVKARREGRPYVPNGKPRPVKRQPRTLLG